MVIPALLLARWWALGGWGKRLCVEEWAEGERGGGWWSEDSDWRVRGRMDEKMGNEYTEISDGSKGGVLIELTMTVSLSPHICSLLSSPGGVSHHIFMRPRLLGYASAPITFIHALLCPLYCHHRLYPSDARKNTRTSQRRRPNSYSANPS
jgi:hypothetical protein